MPRIQREKPRAESAHVPWTQLGCLPSTLAVTIRTLSLMLSIKGHCT